MAVQQPEITGSESDREAKLVAEAVAEHIGPQSEWAAWPGGYGARVDLALIDAVASIRLSYGRERADATYTGVRDIVHRYRTETSELDRGWLEHLAGWDPAVLGETLRNRNRLGGGSTKAEAIVRAASNLVESGLTTRAGILSHLPAAKVAYTRVKGLGAVTFEYFAMLLGADGVKADTWVIRFVSRSLGHPVTATQANAAVKGAAVMLGCDARDLDHAIWSFASTTSLAAMPGCPGEASALGGV